MSQYRDWDPHRHRLGAREDDDDYDLDELGHYEQVRRGLRRPAPGKVTLTQHLRYTPPPAGAAVQLKPRSPAAEATAAAWRAKDRASWGFLAGRYEEPLPTADPDAAVQAKSSGMTADPDEVHAAAAEGVQGSGEPLPFLDKIQKSFGGHDLSGVRAHIGGKAADAAAAIGASAFATGNDVAFEKAPDVRTAAHEAAHVVQQRAGVQLLGGVGEAGDKYERQADAVGDAVVRGESVEELLGGTRGAAAAAAAPVLQNAASVQRQQAPVTPPIPVSGPMQPWTRRRTRGLNGIVTVNGQRYNLARNRKLQFVDAQAVSAALRAAARTRTGALPTQLAYELRGPGNTLASGGNLLADATDGSQISLGSRRRRKRWIKSAGKWQRYYDSYYRSTYMRARGIPARKGLYMKGGGRVGPTILRLRDEGKLVVGGSTLRPSDRQISIIHGIAKAESGGVVATIWTADNMFVSMGFMQRTLGWGQIQELMQRAPQGFARHGLTLGSGRYRRSSTRLGQMKTRGKKIKVDGVPRTPAELRTPVYAARFFRACSEPDVIAAQVEVLLRKISSANQRKRRHGQPRRGRGAQSRYWDDLSVQALITEIENNKPAYLNKIMRQARQRGINSARNRGQFLRILGNAVKAVYAERGQPGLGRNIVANVGRNVRLIRPPRRPPPQP